MFRERFATLLESCHQLVDSRSVQLLSKMFDEAAPVLLELADKAQTNLAQQRFFEAMRAVRDHRAAMARTFGDDLRRQFHEPPPPGGPRPLEDVLELALLDQDALDEALAVQNMIARAEGRYAHELYGLRQRLALVAGGRKLGEDEIPGGPRRLAEAFRAAVRPLPVEPETRLVVLVLFDRFVMGALADTYRDYNGLLVGAGLLPHLRYDIALDADAPPAGRRRGADGRPRAAPRGEPATLDADPAVSEETFEAVCRLLLDRRDGGAPGRPRGAGADLVPRPVLVSAIQRLQHAESPPAAARRPPPGRLAAHGRIDGEGVAEIRAALSAERDQLFGQVPREQMEGIDAEVIDLVGMIFEYMLNDDGLPNLVKALLSHLHTPLLKVAITDKQFFTRGSHPARRLLDAMIDAGSRYVVESDPERGIFPHLDALVTRVRHEFDDHVGLFEVLLSELQHRVEQMRSIADVTERRAREAATGQDRLEHARRRGAEAVEAGLRGRAVPGTVARLLRHSLAEKLAFILLRDPRGEQGRVWTTALGLIEDIVASTEPTATDAAAEARRRALPERQQRVRTALDTLAGFGADDAARLYAEIAVSQLAALSAAAHQRTSAPPPPAAEDRGATRAKPGADPRSVLSPQERRVFGEVEQLDFGTWFDFVPGGSEPRRRLKLAWYTPMAGRYMFVDAMGMQAAILSRRDLAGQMVAGRIRVSVPERRPFLERALEAVRRLLAGGEQFNESVPAA